MFATLHMKRTNWQWSVEGLVASCAEAEERNSPANTACQYFYSASVPSIFLPVLIALQLPSVNYFENRSPFNEETHLNLLPSLVDIWLELQKHVF